ncbi:CRISPR-associated protein 1 [Asimina triloba]
MQKLINPAETFGDIVIDYPYVECTSAAIQALAPFRKLYPGHRKEEIERCIKKAVNFIEKIQAPDVCFTYAIWFGVKALVAVGKTYQSSSSIRKACDFLLSKQLPSGGWGESYLSCQNKVYTNLKGGRSHAVNTGWAMLALIDAEQLVQYMLPGVSHDFERQTRFCLYGLIAFVLALIDALQALLFDELKKRAVMLV